METTHSLRVLVVDDEPDLVQSTIELLTAHGFHAAGVFGGREALDAAFAAPPDVVLLDLGMPGVDGFEVATRLCNDLRRPPIVIAVTAVAEEVGGDRALASGFHLYLTKPVAPAALLEVLGVCERAVALGSNSDDTTTLPGP